MEKISIERLDNFGRGIGYINDKIVFVNDCLPGEVVNCEIIKENKNYIEAKLINVEEKSKKRITPKCKYYKLCGGCQLQHLNYSDTLEYKLNKIKNILLKNKLYDKDINIIENKDNFNYRNKIELKIKNNKIGFYRNKSHDVVEIDECIVTKNSINKVISDIKSLNLSEAYITIRTNYNDEILLIVDTKSEFQLDKLKENNKVVGVILNDNIIYGQDYFTEIINNLYFKVSYNSFFQVNEYICSKLFDIIEGNINDNEVVMDLYCGVGTLSIVASKKASKVYGIEIVENAVINATINAKINNRNNLYFMCGDVAKLIDKINDKIDTIIVDPPRAGLDKKTISTIIEYNPKKMIYVSCDPQTLARDLKELTSSYEIESVTVLDMFSYSYHCETCVILKSKE